MKHTTITIGSPNAKIVIKTKGNLENRSQSLKKFRNEIGEKIIINESRAAKSLEYAKHAIVKQSFC